MTTSKEISLLDSNVIVYAADSSSPFHIPSRTLRDKGFNGEISLCVCPQVLKEFFAVITNPKRVTTPITPAEAMAEVENYFRAEKILKIYPGADILARLIILFGKYEVKRQEIFDLQLVATMLSNDIKRLYTYNKEHFLRFTEIEVLTP